jgi:hypothetical protein
MTGHCSDRLVRPAGAAADTETRAARKTKGSILENKVLL